MDCDILHSNFNRMWIVKVRFLHMWCYMLFRDAIRKNVNENHILLWTGDLKGTVIRWCELIRYNFSATADLVVKGAYWYVVFTTPVSICYAALAAFIDNRICSVSGTRFLRMPVITDSPIIVAKSSKYLSTIIIGEIWESGNPFSLP